MNDSSQSAVVDILIVGGGLVGLSLAAALRGSPLSVALVDAQAPPPKPDKSLKARALVLNAGSVNYLKKLGVWSALAADATPLCAVHLSKQGCLARTRFRASDYDLDHFGHVIAADHLLYGMHHAVQDTLKIYHERKITSLQRSTEGWDLVFEDASTLQAKLIVAADGVDSFVRASQGIAVEVITDDNQALMFNMLLAQDHQGIAYERWTSDGSIALLPFGGKRVKGVWMVPKAQAQALLSLSDTAFLAAVQDCFGYSLGLFQALSVVQAMPLRRLQSTTLYDHHLVLIGNAANTLHPIAAQGFNLGLRDVAALAKILNTVSQKDLLSTIALLKAYALSRAADHRHTREWTECLAKTPGYQALGLWLAECLEPFKQWIVEKNAG
ncbi:MAG: FAD-dependent monooxygenase [Gammaproteobacteria bacterium]|nr:FAD-dependent monooxygenase [Gammaproteobacteria bacterium]